MSSNSKLDDLKAKLREMFQIDQAELDFGIYRIMNTRSEEVDRFLDNDLLPQIREALAEFEPDELRKAREELAEIQKSPGRFAEEYKAEVRRKVERGLDTGRLEEDVYSHLLAFFSRYYNEGDFLARHLFKPGVYAIPYDGKEVKLHWANADQYYIKSSEDFRTYAFQLADQRRVRFELVFATTEDGNKKATADKERRFILYADDPVALDGEDLVIRFEYRPDEERRRQTELNEQAVATILSLSSVRGIPDWSRWHDGLASMWRPRDRREASASAKAKDRTVLEKHLTDYTAKNCFDYFIHKDLRGFLRRELDFFIKNEVMMLDDIEGDSAPRVEHYLSKLRVIRRIAHLIIDFLAQLENFQKKLWLKKKLVLKSHWLVTLDRVPEKFYPEIIANDRQHDAWVDLLAIDEVAADLTGSVAYSRPLTPDFLKAHPSLVLDTALFPRDFKERLLAEFDNLDGESTGLLVQGENFQSLRLLEPRYRGAVQCAYIDPPYNTGGDGFAYKDGYQRSSWLTMVRQSVGSSVSFLDAGAALFSSIDDGESDSLKMVLTDLFGDDNHIADIIWQKRYAPDVRTTISDAHEYIYCFSTDAMRFKERRNKLPLTEAQTKQFSNPDNDPRGPWKADNFTAPGFRQNQMYTIVTPSGREVKPPPGRCWGVVKENFDQLTKDARMYYGKDGNGLPAVKRFLSEMDGMVPWTWWPFQEVGHSQDGLKDSVAHLGRDEAFATAKPVKLLERIISVATSDSDTILDFFAGSGTAAVATIRLNRAGGSRKFILVEAGDHFDTALRQRVMKSVYTDNWNEGKPKSRDGSSALIHYIRLESYEDTLDNLELVRTAEQQRVLGTDGFEEARTDYLIHYMLDVESKGSLLAPEWFEAPFDFRLAVKRGDVLRDLDDGDDGRVTVDLVDTFNWLLGLRVRTMRRSKEIYEVTGIDPLGDKVLILWRDARKVSNADLETWFQRQQYNSRDTEFDVIYVNGDNTIENLRRPDQTWKVRLIEEAFHELMFAEEI